jgi:hypothetical protein
MTLEARVANEKFLFAGEAIMSQAQQDQYQALLGDFKGRVSVSRDEAEKDFGNGGGIGVTVTLTCGQTQEQLRAATHLAFELADGAVKYYQPIIKQDLINRGVLKP